MADTVEIVKVLNQAASMAYDGMFAEEVPKFKTRKEEFDLNSTEGNTEIEGWGVKISGKTMRVTYHKGIMPDEVSDGNYEKEVSNRFADFIKDVLKPAYRKGLKETLRLKDVGNLEVIIQNLTPTHFFAMAFQDYTIENMNLEWNEMIRRGASDHKSETMENLFGFKSLVSIAKG